MELKSEWPCALMGRHIMQDTQNRILTFCCWCEENDMGKRGDAIFGDGRSNILWRAESEIKATI